MAIGADLLAVPFGDMIYSMANAIAKSQRELDKASLRTLTELAGTQFDFIENITEVLEPDVQTVTTSSGKDITVTGVKVDTTISPPTKLTLLQAGLTPTFYQFTESEIEVKISLKTTTEADFGINVSADYSVERKLGIGNDDSGFSYSHTSTYTSHVDASFSAKYSYSAEGSSRLRTLLKPVPPPTRVMPRFVSVNAFFNPPQVNISQ